MYQSQSQNPFLKNLVCNDAFTASPLGSLGVPALDSLFLRAAPPHAPPNSSLNRGDVVEIQGPAASGKTWLVYQMVMSCILPYKLPEEPSSTSPFIGGWNRSVIILDTQGRWSANQLAKMLRSRLQKAKLQPDAVNAAIEKSLQKVHIFRANSSASLAATIFRLPHYYTSQMPDEEIGLLAIDNISTYYWEDRHEAEQQRASGMGPRDAVNNLSKILFALQEFRLSHGPVIVFTNWALVHNSNAQKERHDREQHSTGLEYKQHLLPFPAPFDDPPRQPLKAHLMPPITHQISVFPASQSPGSANFSDSQNINRNRRRTVSGVLRAEGAVEFPFEVALEEGGEDEHSRSRF